MTATKTDIYFDFEFIDDGKAITPISLGMCTQPSGEAYVIDKPPHELYIEYAFDPAQASDWVRENVFPNLELLKGSYIGSGMRRCHAANIISDWVSKVCGENKPPIFWGYYPSYDWVCLMQHWGTLMQKPKGWPSRPI